MQTLLTTPDKQTQLDKYVSQSALIGCWCIFFEFLILFVKVYDF